MRKWFLILSFLLFTGCVAKTGGKQSLTNTNNSTVPAEHRSTVYLIHGQAQLASQDLQSHPEVVVVQTFDEFKQYASQRIALWVDKSATPFTPEQQDWMNQAPQAYYPVVLVGSSDTLHSFRDLLGLCCFMGPSEDPGSDAPGFSVIQRQETNDPASPVASFIKGYPQTPTAQAILEVTNGLLAGGANLTPTEPSLPAATATVKP